MPTPSLQIPSRDSVTTIRPDGSRPFMYPADARGRFNSARRIAAYALIAFYLSLPWIKVNGFPAVFLDVAERRFHLVGFAFAAQDLWLLFFVITGVGFALFFVTALLGRVWCGWACPQTVFLEYVYRPIERLVEGDAVRRRALAAAPMSLEKFFKQVLKHGIYLLVSIVLTHLFLAYFVSVPAVWEMVRHAPSEHGSVFVFMAAYTSATYFIFAWFREQVCIVICPYGRIQSALTDDHTLVIGYDVMRGDPPSPRLRRAGPLQTEESRVEPPEWSAKEGLPADLSAVALAKEGPPAVGSAKEEPARRRLGEGGDCIACNRCVHVCPTGIDIRQGLQMECLGCTACIDACDDVMTRIGRPRGLIRYDSQRAFSGKPTRWIRPRTILYFVLLLIGTGVATWALSTVKPANFGITRMIGAPYIIDEASVRNQFLVRIVNKRNVPATFSLRLDQAPAGMKLMGFEHPVVVGPLGELVQPLILQQARQDYTGPFHFEVRAEDAARSFHLERKVDFLGPEARLLRQAENEKHERR